MTKTRCTFLTCGVYTYMADCITVIHQVTALISAEVCTFCAHLVFLVVQLLLFGYETGSRSVSLCTEHLMAHF